MCLIAFPWTELRQPNALCNPCACTLACFIAAAIALDEQHGGWSQSQVQLLYLRPACGDDSRTLRSHPSPVYLSSDAQSLPSLPTRLSPASPSFFSQGFSTRKFQLESAVTDRSHLLGAIDRGLSQLVRPRTGIALHVKKGTRLGPVHECGRWRASCPLRAWVVPHPLSLPSPPPPGNPLILASKDGKSAFYGRSPDSVAVVRTPDLASIFVPPPTDMKVRFACQR